MTAHRWICCYHLYDDVLMMELKRSNRI